MHILLSSEQIKPGEETGPEETGPIKRTEICTAEVVTAVVHSQLNQ